MADFQTQVVETDLLIVGGGMGGGMMGGDGMITVADDNSVLLTDGHTAAGLEGKGDLGGGPGGDADRTGSVILVDTSVMNVPVAMVCGFFTAIAPAMPGYCTFTATLRPSTVVARCT